jgi:hypothetical protein
MFLSGRIDLDSQFAAMNQEQIQNYRNLRHCLLERRSVNAAYAVRTTQLRAERKSEIWPVRFVSWVYDTTSGYGNIPHRAIALMLGIMLWNCLLIWVGRLSVVNLDCEAVKEGTWLGTLCGASVAKGMVSAFLLGFQPFIDPLGPFREDRIVLASTFWTSLWLWFSSIACLALLAIASIGIRRGLKD